VRNNFYVLSRRITSLAFVASHPCTFSNAIQQFGSVFDFLLFTFDFLLSMTEYFKIGKLVTTFGLKGELVLKHNLGKKTSLKGLAAIFIEERKESFIPWFIESTKIKNEEEVYLKIEGIDTREQAHKLTQKEVWLPEADFKKFSSKSSPINLLGYEIIEEATSLGKILEVIEQPHQLLCRIEVNGKEALIPLHEETVIKIDKRKQQVIVALPPGLLEIYQ
jgi:16S rRNA processing protein RimM